MIEQLIPTPSIVTGSIIAALIVTAILAYFNRRQLYVIVPRLFSYSHLSSGQIIELTILNRGKKTEEEVEVQLSPSFTYTIIATTFPSLELTNQGLIKLHRLAKGEDISIVLSVENGEFTQESVFSVTSKDTKGKVKNKIEESQETTPSAVITGLLFIFVFMPLLGYFLGNIIADDIVPRLSPKSKVEQQMIEKLKVKGWEEIDDFVHISWKDDKLTDWPVTISFPKRSGDLLRFKVDINNELDKRIEYTVSLSSPYNRNEYIQKEGKLPNYIDTNIVILPSQKVSRFLEAYVPYNAPKKLVIFNFSVQIEGHYKSFKYVWKYEQKK